MAPLTWFIWLCSVHDVWYCVLQITNGGGSVDSRGVSASCGADENTLEPILVSEVYPKKPVQCDEEGLRIPFQELHGESVEHLGRTGSDGIIALSNYRLFVLHKDSFINIPVNIVESVEYRDIFYMHVFCKDARTLRYSVVWLVVELESYKNIKPKYQLWSVKALCYLAIPFIRPSIYCIHLFICPCVHCTQIDVTMISLERLEQF